MADRKFWWHMDNGQQRREIEFTAFIRSNHGGEYQKTFKVANPPIYDNEPDTFSRLGYEQVVEVLKHEMDIPKVHHVIRGQISESGMGVRDCYVFSATSKIPFAVIRPSVFVR